MDLRRRKLGETQHGAFWFRPMALFEMLFPMVAGWLAYLLLRDWSETWAVAAAVFVASNFSIELKEPDR